MASSPSQGTDLRGFRWRSSASKVSISIVVGAFVLVLGGAFYDPSIAPDRTAPDVMPAKDIARVVRPEKVDDAAVRESVSKVPGESIIEIVADGRVVWCAEPIAGPLSSSSKAAIADRCLQAGSWMQAELAKKSAKVATAEDLLIEAGLIRQIAQIDAIQKALAADDYLILRRDVEVPRDLRDVDVVSNHYSEHLGDPVDVVFLLEHSRYPGIAAAKRRVLDLDEFRMLDAVRKFNEKSYEERSRLFEAHLDAKARLHAEPPPEVASRGRLAVAIWHEDQGHSAATLPSYFVVAPGSLIASIAPDR